MDGNSFLSAGWGSLEPNVSGGWRGWWTKLSWGGVLTLPYDKSVLESCAIKYRNWPIFYTMSQKTVQNCFCQKFVKFPSILIIIDRRTAKRLELFEVHLFSTSPNSLIRVITLPSALCDFSICGALEKHLLTYLLTVLNAVFWDTVYVSTYFYSMGVSSGGASAASFLSRLLFCFK